MKTIKEYQLFGNLMSIEMTIGAEILGIKTVGNDLYMFAIVDLSRRKQMREFITLCTDDDFHLIDYKYIDTVSWGGEFVHLFEV